MTIFIVVAAVAAPLLSSFPDAALVHWFRGEPFALVLRRRFTSNCLTALTLLPALLALCVHGPRWVREARRPRLIEAAALAAGFAIALRVVLATDTLTGEGALSPHPPRVIILPFLLWASVRFGTAGASLTLLGASLAAVYDAIVRAPVATPEAADGTILALQLFLIALAIPLLCMAALMEERYRSRVLIADRLLFEAMLARLSATFVHVSGTDLLAACRSALERMGRFFGADALLLVEFATPGTRPQDVAAWSARHGTSPGDAMPSALFPWATGEILRDREVWLQAGAPRSTDAEADYALLEASGYRAMFALPLASSGRVIGALTFFTTAPRPPWTSEWLNRVRQAAELFGRALARRQADEALRASEAMKSAILAAIAGSVAVLDRHGVIVTANGPWIAAADDQSLTTIASTAAGSFLESCRASAAAGFAVAADVLNGVQAVLAGTTDTFSLEYRAEPTTLDRWFLVSIVSLRGAEGGAVVTHTDTSARKRAELAAQRSREALAHATHVSAMSELASSLAHQLNQPLTGILESARAARDLLATSGFEPAAVDERLRDIVTEDARASDVIRRLHDLLWKGGAPERRRLDFNDAGTGGRARRAERRRHPSRAARCVAWARRAARDRGPRAAGASAVEPDDQRHGGDERHRGRPPPAGRRHGDGVRRGAVRRPRYRPRPERGSRDPLRAFLHHEVHGYGHGPAHRAHHRRGAWRTRLGRAHAWRRRGVVLRVVAARPGCSGMTRQAGVWTG